MSEQNAAPKFIAKFDVMPYGFALPLYRSRSEWPGNGDWVWSLYERPDGSRYLDGISTGVFAGNYYTTIQVPATSYLCKLKNDKTFSVAVEVMRGSGRPYEWKILSEKEARQKQEGDAMQNYQFFHGFESRDEAEVWIEENIRVDEDGFTQWN